MSEKTTYFLAHSIKLLALNIYLCSNPFNIIIMARPIKKNKNIIQSYSLTSARYKFTVYEKRIMYRLVEYAQSELQGRMIRDNLRRIEHTLWGREITMPVMDILKDENDENYTIAKKAFGSLSDKYIIIDNDEFWQKTHIISNPKIDKRGGMVTFSVFNEIWDGMLNFSKGYRKYELITAMSFTSVYSMRMYELLSGQTRPLQYSLEELREMFFLKDKYPRERDFKRWVLDVAKKELDEHSPYSFNYIEIKVGRKVVAFKFFPTFHPDRKDSELYAIEQQSKLSASAQISSEAYDYFRYSFGFSVSEISKNKKTFIEGEKAIPDFVGFLASLVGPSRTANSRIGYVVNAVKKQTKESR